MDVHAHPWRQLAALSHPADVTLLRIHLLAEAPGARLFVCCSVKLLSFEKSTRRKVWSVTTVGEVDTRKAALKLSAAFSPAQLGLNKRL